METAGRNGKELAGVAGTEGGCGPTGVPATPAAIGLMENGNERVQLFVGVGVKNDRWKSG